MLPAAPTPPALRAPRRHAFSARPMHQPMHHPSEPSLMLAHSLPSRPSHCLPVPCAEMIEGGPCTCCGTTMASIWYGKKGGDKFCKKAACMREGGYLAAKKLKGTAAKRARATAVKEEYEEEIVNVELTVSEVVDIYGQRCAVPATAPAHPCPAVACRPHPPCVADL